MKRRIKEKCCFSPTGTKYSDRYCCTYQDKVQKTFKEHSLGIFLRIFRGWKKRNVREFDNDSVKYSMGRPKIYYYRGVKKTYKRWKLNEITTVKAMQEIGVK